MKQWAVVTMVAFLLMFGLVTKATAVQDSTTEQGGALELEKQIDALEQGEGGKYDPLSLMPKDTEDDFAGRMATSIIMSPVYWFYDALNLLDPVELIFQRPISTRTDAETAAQIDPAGLYLYAFSEEEFNVWALFYSALEEQLPVLLTVLLVVGMVFFMLSRFNPEARNNLKDYLLGVGMAVLGLKFGLELIKIIFDLNFLGTRFFASLVADKLSVGLLDMFIQPGVRSLGMALTALVGVIAISLLNYQFTLRKVLIGFYIALLPLVLAVSVFPSRRRLLEMWIMETGAQILMQMAYAAAYAFFIAWLFASPNFFVVFVMLLSLGSMMSVVRKFLGLQEMGGPAGGALGAGALMGAASLASGVFRGGAGAGGVSGAAAGIGGRTSAMRSMVGKVGTGIGAAAGAVTLGAAAGNTGLFAGATLGAGIGKTMGSGLGGLTGSSLDAYQDFRGEHEAFGTTPGGYAADKLGLKDAGHVFHGASAAELGRRIFSGVPAAAWGKDSSAAVMARGIGGGLGHSAAATARTANRISGGKVGGDAAERAAAMTDHTGGLHTLARKDKKDLKQFMPEYKKAMAEFGIKKSEIGPGTDAFNKERWKEISAQYRPYEEKYRKLKAAVTRDEAWLKDEHRQSGEMFGFLRQEIGGGLSKDLPEQAESKVDYEMARLRTEHAGRRAEGGVNAYEWN